MRFFNDRNVKAILRTVTKFNISRLCEISQKTFKIPNMSYTNDSTKHKKKNLNFAGIFTAITTPFNSDESIAFDKLESNIQKWNELPFKGYVIEGCTGEYVYLTTEEKLQVVKKSRELIGRDKILIGATRETIYVTKKMAELGVDAVMVVTPSYYKSKMTDEALIRHYEEVANNSPVPIVLYNVPIFTNIDIGILKIGQLLERTKNEDFQLVVASAGILQPALQLGAVGTFCALSNVLGKEVCDLYDLCLKGTSAKEEAHALQNSLIAPNTAVCRTYGMAGLKEILDLKGFYGGPTRSPLLTLKKDEVDIRVSVKFKVWIGGVEHGDYKVYLCYKRFNFDIFKLVQIVFLFCDRRKYWRIRLPFNRREVASYQEIEGGAVGGICSLANVLGNELCDLFQLYTKGPSGKDEAVALQSTLVAPNIGVTKKYGIAGLKEIMELKGLYGGPTRSPLQKLTPEELEDIKSMFKGSGHL
ncbi:4-hydroxy-2-oxoglutarate aldolase, mitochondrial [Armadillidium nasatum]|uniref:4-hydroxy-2-oxoglutarate aldolase, mitochondrial n=1 Tax=Armadillidium nasatum TaxID=96803 RepID=A0A5N5SI21_9CRUS|nr:4-hydroxy-2-oxoglutarate aldolase, mitochondrial [Armadillidium nasatum]